MHPSLRDFFLDSSFKGFFHPGFQLVLNRYLCCNLLSIIILIYNDGCDPAIICLKLQTEELISKLLRVRTGTALTNVILSQTCTGVGAVFLTGVVNLQVRFLGA